MRCFGVVVLLLVASLVSGTLAQQGGGSPPVLARDIEALVTTHTSLLMRKDAAALAALFTEDAVYVGATGATHSGRSRIRDFYAQTFAMLDHARSVALVGDITRETRVDQVHSLGDGAWAFGRGRLLAAGPYGVVVRTDHWMAVYARVGGEWKIRMMSVGEDADHPSVRQ
jgi:ketosteroid isomerase-like protein